ncbi:MAG: RAMP superfamily CRISPR-associated protein [candidate division KSB1 bacterium]|nr:RAMP superfamily CRISPR-associated protein [candidate division KSB1 bacterium]
MHGGFVNEIVLTLRIMPRSPLLIKSGAEGDLQIDPTLPDMNFVRTYRNGRSEVYLPGSSLRGVLRSHAERLIRSVEPEVGNGKGACDPNLEKGSRGPLRPACFRGEKELTEKTGPEAYNQSCRACRIFGNTALAGRVRIEDFHLADRSEPRLEVRHGVAIDRVTGSVAQGPFEMEILVDGEFRGSLTIRNFTLGQFALLCASLLDIGDGLVPIGFGKSKGLGRVQLRFDELMYRTIEKHEGQIRGVGSLAPHLGKDYRLPPPELEVASWPLEAKPLRGFWVSESSSHETIRTILEGLVPLWLREVGR